MQVSVAGKKLQVGEALRETAEKGLRSLVSKYFDHAIEAGVVLAREGHGIRADITVHAARNIVVQAHAVADDARSAFEVAAERVAKRLRRNKRRLRDDHRRGGHWPEPEAVADIVLAAPEDVGDDVAEDLDDPVAAADAPTVIAEQTTALATLTVGEAVMRLDLSNAPFLLFRSSAHGGLCVVYRRDDGHIGWLDPNGSGRGRRKE